MKRRWLSILWAGFLCLAGTCWAAAEKEEILEAIVKVRSAVPKEAHTARTLGTEREGNGVVINREGHILTIGYLIVEAESLEIITHEGKTMKAAFAGYDHKTGFGLLKAEKPLNIKPVKLGKSSEVREGDPVLVVGFGGKEAALTARVIARKEFAGNWEYLLEEAIFTAPAYPNFGGAALINPDGTLVGIGSLFTQITILGLASLPCNLFVPIDLLYPILADLIASGRPGDAPRPWLGLNSEEVHGRVFVAQTTPGGPAEKSGLQRGDIILKVKGEAVSGLGDFYRKIWAVGKGGVNIPLTVLQGTEIREIHVLSTTRYHFLQLKPRKLI